MKIGAPRTNAAKRRWICATSQTSDRGLMAASTSRAELAAIYFTTSVPVIPRLLWLLIGQEMR